MIEVLNVNRREMTADEFFGWLVTQDRRHELVAGQPVMTDVADRRHDRIVVNTLMALDTQSRGGIFHPFTGQTAVRIPSGNIRFPDLGVECGHPRDADMAASEPGLVVEVLSHPARPFDHVTKLEDYKTVVALKHILLIDPDVPRTLLYSRDCRGQWQTEVTAGLMSVVRLPNIAISLAHADLYDGLTFQQRPKLVG